MDSLKNLIAEKKSTLDSATTNLQKVISSPQDKVNHAIATVQSQADSLVQKSIHSADGVEYENSRKADFRVQGYHPIVQGRENDGTGDHPKGETRCQ
jgi:hypothetical protein